MTPIQEQTSLTEWGWRAAVGFIVTGALGLIALSIRRIAPLLGERLHRVYGERAFKTEIERGIQTAAVVARIEPIVSQNSTQLDKLEVRVEIGFARIDAKLEKIGDNIIELAKAVGRAER